MNDKRPAVRITPIAWQHLQTVIEAMKQAGRSRSMIDVTSEAILSIQLPQPVQQEKDAS